MPFVPRKLNTKNSNLDWINLIAGLHDLQCDCSEPLKHTIEEIYKQEPSLDPSKCLTTEKATTEDDGFGPGDLEALFADDGGEDAATTAATTG